MTQLLDDLFKKYKVATAKDIESVFKLMNTQPHNVLVRDVNGGSLVNVNTFAVGPFYLRKDDASYYIAGQEIEKDRERHLRIVDSPVTGTVEIRSPNQSWFQPNMGAIRLYIPK